MIPSLTKFEKENTAKWILSSACMLLQCTSCLFVHDPKAQKPRHESDEIYLSKVYIEKGVVCCNILQYIACGPSN